MTAGVDQFSSGLYKKFDATCLVCEPTRQSLGVVRQTKSLFNAENHLLVVANKVENVDDVEFITSQLGFAPDLVIPRLPEAKQIERGMAATEVKLSKRSTDAIEEMVNYIKKIDQIDRDIMLRQTIESHRMAALDWMNSRFGKDLTLQIDEQFTFTNN